MATDYDFKGLTFFNQSCVLSLLEKTKEEPKIEEEPAPLYNTLEPPSDEEDDGYDDTVDNDDTADYDDIVEPGCSKA